VSLICYGETLGLIFFCILSPSSYRTLLSGWLYSLDLVWSGWDRSFWSVGYVLFKGIEVYWGFHFRVELRYMKFEAVFYCIITLTNDKKSLADAAV
jgi:hypothetical protein